MKKFFCCILAAVLIAAAGVWIYSGSQGEEEKSAELPRIFYSGAGGTVKTLDPAYADDLASRDLTALCYDTLVQYDYVARPYRLVPSMLAAMPEISADRKSYKFTLRDDLFFADDGSFPDKESRKVTAEDVKFSILRIADARNHSPVYWIYRGRIAGLSDFRKRTAELPKDDLSVYDEKLEGFIIHSPESFTIRLTEADQGFLYLLAMPNAGIVSRKAALDRKRGALRRKPAGSGPFILDKWIPNLKLSFKRNSEYRLEYFENAANPADRKRRLPLLDGVEICQIRQSMTQWMLFFQGELDSNALDKDNQDSLAHGGNVIPALAERGVTLEIRPEFEIRYVGFNFRDPILGKNLQLRKALKKAYDIKRRVDHASGMLIPAAGPIPEGVAGFVHAGTVSHPDYAEVKKLLAEAGFADGIDPATGEALKLDFDQAGSTVGHRQMGELAADDWRKCGIEVVSRLNSRPRFADKLRKGKFQLFRYSWIGDYPDAANFLQLFYSRNIGSCNYCGFADAEFDRLYEKMVTMDDSPERSELCLKMVKMLDEKCVWIYEGFPVSGVLNYSWLQNSIRHDFGFVRWKYLSVDARKRAIERKNFKPLSLDELSAGGLK